MTTTLNHIPGPRSLPGGLGHLHLMGSGPLPFFTHLGRTYGDIAAFQLGWRRMVLINHPALIDRVVRDSSFWRSPQTRRAMASFLGQGLLSLEGSDHRRHRRLMQPAFHRERINGYGLIMAEETQRHLEAWRPGEVHDLGQELMALTLKIVARALLGVDASAEARQVDEALHTVLPQVSRINRLSFLLPRSAPLIHGPTTRAAINRLQGLVRRIVAERRAAGGDGSDLLSLLLAATDEDGGSLSDDEVCAEALTILLAGHETTANTLSWAWYLLTQHPEVQERVAAEALAVAGNAPISPEHLPQLSYADQVIRETLRLYPVAWSGDRVADHDAELAGYPIPAGTPVVYSVYVTQRDPRFFPRPSHFDPERFSPARAASIPAGAYLPFGAGVHICIGNAFALMEARLILAELARRFVVRAAPIQTIGPRPSITLGLDRCLTVALAARS
ncbi:MAG: cytochrome P450 [Oscillochloridaceae bacterium umkhey_bin13]